MYIYPAFIAGFFMWEKLKYQIPLHLIIFIWGFTAILGVYIQADAFVLVWFRVVIAFFSLLFFLMILRRPRRILDQKVVLKTLGVGVVVALHWLFFYLAIKVSNASVAIICLSTATIHVAWLEPIIMKRKPLKMEFILGFIIVLGIILITFQGTEKPNFLGITYGLIAAFLAAFFSTANAKLIHTVSASKITLYEMLSASIMMTILLALMGELTIENLSVSLNDFLLLLFLGIICTSIAFLVTVEITKHLGAFTVSLSINMEPIYTLSLAAWLLKEHQELNMYFYLGAIIIVGSVFGNAVWKARNCRKQKKKAIIGPQASTNK